MEQTSSLKMAEGKLSQVIDKITFFAAKLEDLLFRAQRISAAAKNKIKSNDSMFGYDLNGFRRQIQNFSHEIGALPVMVSSLERTAGYEEEALKRAQSLMRVADRVNKSLRTLHDHALLAHQHIREADHKIEAWHLVQEIDQMVSKSQSLPSLANKIVLHVSTAPAAGGRAKLGEPEPSAAAPAAPPQPEKKP